MHIIDQINKIIFRLTHAFFSTPDASVDDDETDGELGTSATWDGGGDAKIEESGLLSTVKSCSKSRNEEENVHLSESSRSVVSRGIFFCCCCCCLRNKRRFYISRSSFSFLAIIIRI